MLSKIWRAKLLHILLGTTFLVGVLPMSNHMLPMPEMHMETPDFLRSTSQEKPSDNHNGSCCEAIGSSLLLCDFVAFQSGYANSNGGSEQFAYSSPIVQLIYIDTLAPPPKA